VAVVQEAYVAGVSTRKVDQVVESLGLRISKSEVSRICEGLDEQVEAFRKRPLEGRYPYLWLDAKVEKVRDGGRVVRKCLVLAYGVHESGYREVIGLDVGECETEAFWRSFLRSLVERGLTGVQLVVSDAHAGLKQAIAQVLAVPGSAAPSTFCGRRSAMRARSSRACSRRCCGRSSTPTRVSRRGRSSPTPSSGYESRCRRWRRWLRRPRRTCSPSMPSRATTGRSCAPPIRSSGSTEVGRRTDVVGIFPNDKALIRLAASVVIEQNDEWLVGRRYLSAHSLDAILDGDKEEEDQEEVRELTAA
jgi:putative transposase